MTAIIVGHSSMLGLALKRQLDKIEEPYITVGRSENSDIQLDLSRHPSKLSDHNIPLGTIDTIYFLASSFEADTFYGIKENFSINSAGAGYAILLTEMFNPKVLIYSGSMSSYDEFDLYRGLSGYGLTKRIAEELFEWCANQFKFRFTSIRFSQLFDDSGLCIAHQPWIGRIVRYAFEKRHLYLPSSEGKRNFLHVDDAARLLIEASTKNYLFGVLNGCSPHQYSYEDLAIIAFSFNKCIDNLHISDIKKPFRPICLPEDKNLYEVLNQQPMISPTCWIQNIASLKSWPSFGPMDVEES